MQLESEHALIASMPAIPVGFRPEMTKTVGRLIAFQKAEGSAGQLAANFWQAIGFSAALIWRKWEMGLARRPFWRANGCFLVAMQKAKLVVGQSLSAQ